MTTDTRMSINNQYLPSLERTAFEVVDVASNQAKLLMDIVEKTKCYQTISGKKYLQVEAWETIGAFNRTHAETRDITAIIRDNDTVGYNAHVQLWKDGIVVGGAVMPCFFTENACKGKEDDAKHKACMSAAQTFATSKAYRMNFSYVAILAGYAPTPAEEMTGYDSQQGEGDLPNKKAHWCTKHNTEYFKRGKMKAFAHPVAGQEGEWCSEPVEKKDEKKEGETGPAPAIKTLGDLFTACTRNHSEQFATKEDVLKYLKKTEADIVDPAGEYAEIEKKLKV
jgi:hypothetical protein